MRYIYISATALELIKEDQVSYSGVGVTTYTCSYIYILRFGQIVLSDFTEELWIKNELQS